MIESFLEGAESLKLPGTAIVGYTVGVRKGNKFLLSDKLGKNSVLSSHTFS